MTRFYYKAVNRGGEVSEGEIDAPDRGEVVAQLQRRGFTPIRANPVEETRAGHGRPSWFARGGARISPQDLARLTDEIATLLGAGLELDRTLGVVAETAEHERIRRILHGLQGDIRAGRSFSDALAARPEIFSQTYTSLVRAGEAAGVLPEVMERLADHQGRMLALRDAVVSALIYPLILVAISGVSVMVIVGFVMPRFKAIFDEMGAALPWLTQVVMAAGGGVRHWWWLLAGVVIAGAWGGERLLRDPRWRRRIHAGILRSRGIGGFVQQWEAARFCRTLGVLVDNGVPLSAALRVAIPAIGNQHVAEAVTDASDRVRLGQAFADALGAAQVFPGHAVQMIRVGEETGELGRMLLKVADVYDRQVRIGVQRALALLEPVLILGLAAVIAVIILSLLLAVLGMNDLPL